MSSSISGTTGITFPDSTTQATAANPNVVTTIYTSPATWAKPSTVKFVKVTVLSGGGSGASRQNTAPQTASGGGGGGGGIGFFPAPSVPGPIAVTVGAGGTAVGPASGSGVAGGTSSFGALISATGGGAGNYTTSTSATAGGSGGSITPSPAIVGSPGGPGLLAAASSFSAGGDPFGSWGFGGNPTTVGINAVGNGGGGSATTGGTPTGTGKAGFVIVEEFY